MTGKTGPQGCTNLRLRQLMRRVGHLYDVQMAAAGLKSTQFSLLAYIEHSGPRRPADIATGLKLDASTLSRNLRPLADAGWVVISEGVDSRSRLVSLTRAGSVKLDKAKKHWRVAQDNLNRLLGKGNVATLHALIDESLDRLEPDADGDSAA